MLEQQTFPPGCRYPDLFRLAVAAGWAGHLLSTMDTAATTIARQQPGPARSSRLAAFLAKQAVSKQTNLGFCPTGFVCLQDLLGAMAEGRGGLRSGPAHNPEFAVSLELLEAGQVGGAV